MRAALALAAALFAGCGSMPAGDFFAPDEFNAWYAYSDVDSSGRVDHGADSRRGHLSGDGDVNTIGGGFTWYLGPSSVREIQALHAEIRAWRVEQARAAAARVLDPYIPQEAPEAPVIVSVETSVGSTPDPGMEIEAESGEEAAPSAPVPVSLESASDDVWLKLISAGGVFLVALAGWLGRQRIPVVRGWTKEGRARKAAEDE